MTALATIPAHDTIDVEIMDPTGGRLIAWASALSAASQIGKALCQTQFAPAHFRGKPEDTAAAILYGDELGLTPAQSVRSVFVINGTPGLYARTMVAIVMARGHEIWTVEKSDSKVTVAGRRRGTSHVIEETWNTARAQKAGYTTNKKYGTDPQAMLYARAAADVARQIAPDALAGLAYTVEEIELQESPTVTVTRSSSTAGTSRKVQRKAQPEPELEAAPKSTPEQRSAIREAFDATQTAAEQRPVLIAEVVGRKVGRLEELTAAEADAVIEAVTVAEVVPVEDPPADGEFDASMQPGFLA